MKMIPRFLNCRVNPVGKSTGCSLGSSMTKQDYIKLEAYELQVAQMVKFRMTQTILAFAYCEEEYTKDCVIKE